MPNQSDISLTFSKGMSVLKCFDAETTHLSVPEISRRTGLDRAVARRLVLTLVHLGYVAQQDRSFTLTPRILVLAGGFLQGRRFGKLIQPLLAAYASQAGLPLSLAMADGDEAVYVAHAGDQDTPRIGFTIGSRVPMEGTALGKALSQNGGGFSEGRLYEAEGTVEPGILGLATPVISKGKTVAAIGTSGPTEVMRDALRRAHIEPAMTTCAQALGELF